jgi:hypothetical protein
MTTAASSWPQLGTQPVGNFFVPDNTQRHRLGATLSVVDPFYGGQELIYLAVPTSTALNVGHAVTWDVNNRIVALPNSANQGVPVAFALNAVASDASNIQFSWFIIEGQALCWSNASVAAAALIGVVAAGQLGANSAGKEILNARVAAAATTTVAKANTATQSGSTLLRLTAGTDGWFVGIALSGTGIAASTVVTAIDPDNRTVTMNNAATATGSVTVTGTRNDATNFWNLVVIDRPFAQGAIT